MEFRNYKMIEEENQMKFRNYKIIEDTKEHFSYSYQQTKILIVAVLVNCTIFAVFLIISCFKLLEPLITLSACLLCLVPFGLCFLIFFNPKVTVALDGIAKEIVITREWRISRKMKEIRYPFKKIKRIYESVKIYASSRNYHPSQSTNVLRIEKYGDDIVIFEDYGASYHGEVMMNHINSFLEGKEQLPFHIQLKNRKKEIEMK
ncbi:MAG: hypothetical protein ACTSUE_27320 [Promethearchaeota archaeon]